MKQGLFFAFMIFALAALPAAAHAQSSKADAKSESAKPEPNKQVLVEADSLTLRSKPDIKSNDVATLVTFQPLTIGGKSGDDWTKVTTNDKKTGWVLSKYLTRTGYVSVKQKYVNARQGPGSEYVKLLQFNQNYPLRVLDAAGNGWIRVGDYEGDEGWLHPSFVQTKPVYVITRLAKSNVRDGVGVDAKLVFTAAKGVLFEVIEEKDGWLHVKHIDGDTGWMSSKVVFGWRDHEAGD